MTTFSPPATVEAVDIILRKTIRRMRADEASGTPRWMQTERLKLLDALLEHRHALTH